MMLRLCDARAAKTPEQHCQAGFELMAATVRAMGFDTDGSKNAAPATRGTFLGGGLDSDTEGGPVTAPSS